MITETRGLFYLQGLTLILAWMKNYIHYNVSDEITYSSANFNAATINGAAIEV